LGAGRLGRIRVLKVRYGGYESLEEIVPVGILEGDDEALDEVTTADLLRAPARDVHALEVDVDDEELDDAIEEVLFATASDVSTREHEKFSRAVDQIETSMEDRVLLLERRRADAFQRFVEAEQRRDAAVGAEARTRAEKDLRKRETMLESVDQELERLRRRDDAEYVRWIERANRRRSRPPDVDVLLEVRFKLVGADE
jgi:hypothetical protein